MTSERISKGLIGTVLSDLFRAKSRIQLMAKSGSRSKLTQATVY